VRRRLPAALGAVLVAVAVGFCVATFRREHDRVADALGEARPVLLAAALAVAGAAMVSVAMGWRRCLAALGEERRTIAVARWYFLGELGKYVPGGIWPLVGRGELARRDGIDRGTAYQSVAWSLACWYGAAVLPVAILLGHPRAQGFAAAVADRASRGRVRLTALPWRDVVRLLLSYVPSWVLIGATTSVVVAAFGGPVGWRAPVVAVVAWVAGFAAVPVPAGAGVREAVFVAASGLPDGLALTVAVTARLAFIAVDLLGAAISSTSRRWSQRPT
jgi:glycosyltransferase 2 family protein